MGDEITIKPNSESAVATPAPENQAFNSRIHAANICALGLGMSFFLPWATILGANISGFELQKLGNEQLLLWLIPALCTITIIAGLAKRSQQIAGQLAGALPYVVGIYWYIKLGDDFFKVLTYGAFLSLIFGAGLFILSRKSK